MTKGPHIFLPTIEGASPKDALAPPRELRLHVNAARHVGKTAIVQKTLEALDAAGIPYTRVDGAVTVKASAARLVAKAVDNAMLAKALTAAKAREADILRRCTEGYGSPSWESLGGREAALETDRIRGMMTLPADA